jgi:ABC-type nickel/cobalt efflux system permease component RcnA
MRFEGEMAETQTKNVSMKAVAINVGLLLGLLYQSWRGSPAAVVIPVGIFLFVAANVLMAMTAKKQAVPDVANEDR